MASGSESYCWNGRQWSLSDVSYANFHLTEERAIANAILDWNRKDFFQFQTSGSTGLPKQITFTKEQLCRSIELTKNAFDLTDQDTALLTLPMKYVAGKMMLYRALHIGMNLVSVDPKIDLSHNYGANVSFAAFIPLQMETMLLSEEGRNWLNSIRVVLVGGGPIRPELARELALFDNRLYHTYGMTETLTHIAIRRLSKGGDLYYTALPGVSLSSGSESNLVVHAGHLDLRLETNDIVDFKEAGTFEIMGRLDNVINSGGLKISPEHIENTLRTVIKREIAVIGVPDPSLGSKLVLVIEGKQNIDPEWLRVVNEDLPKNQRPKYILYFPEFPRTESGKIQRRKLADIVLSSSDT